MVFTSLPPALTQPVFYAVGGGWRAFAKAQAEMMVQVNDMAERGLRVLGVALAGVQDLPEAQTGFAFRYLGLVGLADPLQGITKIVRADIAWKGIYWEPFIFVGAIFFLFCFGMSRYSMYLERKLKTDHR